MGGAALAAALACAPAAMAAGLPSVSSGQRPGPPLLYEPPPTAPELSLQAPFAAQPLLVSGTDALRGGEYLYQDYLFDDHGADTVPGPGSGPPGSGNFSATAGDVSYPTAARFANNAADIVELRVRRTADAVVYRVTLGTVLDDDTTVVGIGIDTDAAGTEQVDWPRGAEISSPGLDRFVTAWGTGGQVSTLSGAPSTTALPAGSVSIDQQTNQMTIRVPRSTIEPGSATWRLVAGAGLFTGDTSEAGDAWKDVSSGDPSEETPGSGSSGTAPGVLNLAFRFDEPQSGQPGAGGYTTAPGIGNFFEDKQASVLAEGTSGDFHADLNFGEMAAGTTRDIHAPGPQQARIFASGQSIPEGVKREFPEFGGRLQPYLIRVPPALDRSQPAGLTFSLHSLGGTYTQYAVFSPTQLTQFGDERGNLVVTPLGRGEDGWYTGEAEVDFFEVWRDVAANFSLDPERVYPSGYSMGGYGTYKLGVHYPDLFARAFTTVGPPGLGIWPVVAPPSPAGRCRSPRRCWATCAGCPTSTGWARRTSWCPTPAPRRSRTASTSWACAVSCGPSSPITSGWPCSTAGTTRATSSAGRAITATRAGWCTASSPRATSPRWACATTTPTGSRACALAWPRATPPPRPRAATSTPAASPSARPTPPPRA